MLGDQTSLHRYLLLRQDEYVEVVAGTGDGSQVGRQHGVAGWALSAEYSAPDAAFTLLAPETRLAFGSVGGGLFDGSKTFARHFGESLFNGPSPRMLRAQKGMIKRGEDYVTLYRGDAGKVDEFTRNSHGALARKSPMR